MRDPDWTLEPYHLPSLHTYTISLLDNTQRPRAIRFMHCDSRGAIHIDLRSGRVLPRIDSLAHITLLTRPTDISRSTGVTSSTGVPQLAPRRRRKRVFEHKFLLEIDGFALTAALHQQRRRLGQRTHVEPPLLSAPARAPHRRTTRHKLIRRARDFGVLEFVDGGLSDRRELGVIGELLGV